MAFGRPLCVVHREPCAQQAHAGVYIATTAAMSGVRTLLKVKAPNALNLIDRTVRLTRQIKEVQEP